MSNELKPVAYMINYGIGDDRPRTEASLVDTWYSMENAFEHYKDDITPLYAIPEGYHIVAIDHEQEQRDNLERHNEKVRGDHEN